jgi:hypothetical protein
MADIESLARLVGKDVELQFANGHVVRANLVTVDLDEPREIIYRVREIIATGPPKLAGVKPGVVAAADPSGLLSFRVL